MRRDAAKDVVLDGWLQKRLTAAKAAEPRWADLAEAVEKLWGEFFDPEISRLERMRSSYTADDRDLARIIRLMGDYFSFELPREEDRPVSLAWRRLEIEYKDIELILRSAFRRHFGDFRVEWFPLFAPKEKPYGSEFVVGNYLANESDKNVPPDGYFLTSRGVVGVDMACMYRDGMDKELFRREAAPLVRRIKPLHIVFDGFIWFMRFNLGAFSVDFSATWNTATYGYELQFGPLGSRFDYLAADARRLDGDIFDTWTESEWIVEFPFWDSSMWRLDMFLPEGFGDRVPLDILLPVNAEGFCQAPFLLLHHEKTTPFFMDMTQGVADTSWNTIRHIAIPVGSAEFQARENAGTWRPFFTLAPPRRYDTFLPDGFGDKVPLDTLVAGAWCECAVGDYLNLAYQEKSIRWTITVPDRLSDPGAVANRVDAYLPDGFADRLPLDVLWGDILADTDSTFVRILFRETERCQNITIERPSLQSTSEHDRAFEIRFLPGKQYRALDTFLPDGFADKIPLDLLRVDPEKIFSAIYSERTHKISLGYFNEWRIEYRCKREWHADVPLGEPTLTVSSESFQGGVVFAAFQEGEPTLDRSLCFDDVPADFMPLDMPCGGFL